MDDVFKALADPTRRSLLDELYPRDGQSLTELERRIPMSRIGVMKHLRVLEAAGLVATRRRGQGEAAFPEPGPDQARPRPLGEQVRGAVGGSADRPEEATGGGRDGEGVRDLHQDHAGAPVGGDHRSGGAGDVLVRRRDELRLDARLDATRRGTRPRTFASPRARTSRSTRRAGSCRASTRSGATT